MGADASRLRTYKRRKTKKCSSHQQQYSRASSSYSSFDDAFSDWALLGTMTLNAWRAGDAELYGFDLFDNWHIYNLKVQKKPWSAFHVVGKMAAGVSSKGGGGAGKKDAKICSFPCEVEETGREEKVSWWIKDMSVLAMNSKVIVVQIIISKAVKILVVNWHLETLLGTYTFAYTDEACVQDCYVSPNSDVLLLRQNLYLRRVMGHLTNFDPNIRVIRVCGGLCERVNIVEDCAAFNSFGSGISFDPRFPEGRAVIVSSSIQNNDAGAVLDPDTQGVQIYDVTLGMVVQTTESVTDKIIHHMKHSPDGSLIAILCISMSAASFTTIFVESVQIMNADSLRVLHTIPFPDYGPVKPLHACAFPAFSRNGHFLAQVHMMDSGVTTPHSSHAGTPHVGVYQMPVTEMSLQCFCRSVILHYTPHRNLGLLPLPRRLIEYLQFKF